MSSRAGADNASLVPILILAVTLAACSILYQLLAAQTLTMLAANTVIWYSIVVGLFLASMGIGAFLSEHLGADSPWRALLRVELALTVLGSVTVPLILVAHTVYAQFQLHNELAVGLTVFFSVVFPMVCVIGVLTGAELPLLMRLARQVRDESRATNLALGWDYMGSLLGAMIFPLLIVPLFDLLLAGLMIASINLGVALWIAVTKLDLKIPRIQSGGLLATGLLLALAFSQIATINQYFLHRYYYYYLMDDGLVGLFQPRPDLPEVQRHRSRYQVIDIVDSPRPSFFADLLAAYSDKLQQKPDFPVDYKLYLNGALQTDTRLEEVYHEWFAHFPIILSGSVPERVLVMGGGDGFLIRELAKYEEIKEIRHIDIDPVLINLAKRHPVLREVNEDAFSDPRVTTLITDGYQYVRQSDVVYDAIFIDLPVANNYDLAKLYSREFYEFVKKRLGPNGFIVFDASGASAFSPRDEQGQREMLPRNTWPVFGATLKKAGFETIFPYFSRLEVDNPALTQIIRNRGVAVSRQQEVELLAIRSPAVRLLERRKMQREIERRLEAAPSDYMRQGFVFMAPALRTLNHEYWDPGVEMHVLNQTRFELSLESPLKVPETVDDRLVNSILRPTLPLKPWWRPMTAY